MIKNKKVLIALAGLFVIAETVIAVCRHYAQGARFVAFSYGFVLLACVACVLFAQRSKEYFFTQVALVFTVFADYFLVVSEPQQKLPAMLFFSVTQLSYFARLYFSEQSRSRRGIQLIFHAVASAGMVLITLLVLGENCDAVAAVSMFYYANLILNLIFAFLRFRKEPLLALGLLLFACCDTLIGLALLDGYIAVPQSSILHQIAYPGFDLVWACYMPSQVLLVLSLLPGRLRSLRRRA